MNFHPPTTSDMILDYDVPSEAPIDWYQIHYIMALKKFIIDEADSVDAMKYNDDSDIDDLLKLKRSKTKTKQPTLQP